MKTKTLLARRGSSAPPDLTRQAVSIATIRGRRRIFGECADCGAKCDGYRCESCREKVREAQKLLMRARRKAGKA